eukprot:731084-Hanusia_phi.AAC.2
MYEQNASTSCRWIYSARLHPHGQVNERLLESALNFEMVTRRGVDSPPVTGDANAKRMTFIDVRWQGQGSCRRWGQGLIRREADVKYSLIGMAKGGSNTSVEVFHKTLESCVHGDPPRKAPTCPSINERSGHQDLR